jgi:monolysocardiolipin acyltransferase
MSNKNERPAPLEDNDTRAPAPSLAWRIGSSAIVGATGFLCRSFLAGASRLETHGLEAFLQLLDKRRDVDGRERGLITVSNHVSV